MPSISSELFLCPPMVAREASQEVAQSRMLSWRSRRGRPRTNIVRTAAAGCTNKATACPKKKRGLSMTLLPGIPKQKKLAFPARLNSIPNRRWEIGAPRASRHRCCGSLAEGPTTDRFFVSWFPSRNFGLAKHPAFLILLSNTCTHDSKCAE
jgi:hypothetical protein